MARELDEISVPAKANYSKSYNKLRCPSRVDVDASVRRINSLKYMTL